MDGKGHPYFKEFKRAVFLLVLLLLGCRAGSRVVENTGFVCFKKMSQDSKSIYVDVRPPGCYSSSCTEVLEQSGDMAVDEKNRVIRFHSRFEFRDISNVVETCTADCGGAGRLRFEVEALSPGEYEIWLGEERLGSLHMPLSRSVCMGEVP